MQSAWYVRLLWFIAQPNGLYVVLFRSRICEILRYVPDTLLWHNKVVLRRIYDQRMYRIEIVVLLTRLEHRFGLSDKNSGNPAYLWSLKRSLPPPPEGACS